MSASPYSHVLVAVDPAGCARHVCEHAAALASALGSEVTLLHVVHEPPGVPANAQVHDRLGAVHGARELLDEAAAHELADLAAIFARVDRVPRLVVRHGAPAAAILDEATRAGARMLVMGTHGRTGARHLLFGSVAEQVLRRAPCPVVIVRAPAETEDRPSPFEETIAAESMG